MKRFLSGTLAVFFLLTATTAWCTQPPIENGPWQAIEETAEKPSFIAALHEDFQKTFSEIKSAIQTWVHTVITVVTALVKAFITVVTAVVKLVVRFVFAVMLIIVRWLLSLFIPV